MKYAEISFNAAWVASKTFKEFVAHEKHHGLTREQMKEVYRQCKNSSPGKPESSPSLAGEKDREGA